MVCKHCNAQIEEGSKFCCVCGAPVVNEAPSPVTEITAENLPEHLRPLSPWAYFGLQLLYSIPVVGFIFLIIFSFKKSNINRRNFTRSYWCVYIIVIAVLVIFSVLFGEQQASFHV